MTKNEIKHTIQTKISEECRIIKHEDSKLKDRVDHNPDEIQYLQRLTCSIVDYISDIDLDILQWFKLTKKAKSLTCRLCVNDLPETQEHLEICDGTKLERRELRGSEVMGRVIF